MRYVVSGLTAILFCVLVAGAASVPGVDKKKPKYNIKEVMKYAHKSGLLRKVVKGKASKEEKAKLVLLYVALAKNNCPKGDSKAWKKRTENIVKAAKAVAENKEGAVKALRKAINCKGCHSKHK